MLTNHHTILNVDQSSTGLLVAIIVEGMHTYIHIYLNSRVRSLIGIIYTDHFMLIFSSFVKYRCGHIFCNTHSSNRLPLFDAQNSKAEWSRVCDTCFYDLAGSSLFHPSDDR